MADAHLRAVVTADASQATNVLSQFAAGGQISFGKLAGAFAAGQAIFYGAEEALRKVGDTIGDLVSNASEYQDAQTRLQTSINNNTEVTNKTTKALEDQAVALSRVTRFSDDQYVATDSLLASNFRLSPTTYKTQRGKYKRLLGENHFRKFHLSQGDGRANITSPPSCT